MLSTAIVLVCDSDGSRSACRALSDCGSQANFVAKKFVEARFRNASIKCLDLQRHSTVTSSNHVVRIKLQSRLNSYTAAIECIITNQITDKIPVSSARNKFNFPRIRLADPRFHICRILIF